MNLFRVFINSLFIPSPRPDRPVVSPPGPRWGDGLSGLPITSPPQDWTDKAAWNSYFNAELQQSGIRAHEFFSEDIILRFVSLVQEKGGRVWFPGCGLDPYPKAYAQRGCQVLATDFSSVAVTYQQKVAEALIQDAKPGNSLETFVILEQDFTQSKPEGEFDVIVNSAAFQGLAADRMGKAAAHFYAALRPGGACIIDTINVQSSQQRNMIEDSLITAGFVIPGFKLERWYRQQLDSTGILYIVILGRPRIPRRDQYPKPQFDQFAARDQKILDSIAAEYERKCQEQSAEDKALIHDSSLKLAQVVYATG